MAARRLTVRCTGPGVRRFWPLPHAGHEKKEADTHVESYEDVLSDAGSTPAASTNFFLWNQAVTLPVPAASRLLPRLEV